MKSENLNDETLKSKFVTVPHSPCEIHVFTETNRRCCVCDFYRQHGVEIRTKEMIFISILFVHLFLFVFRFVARKSNRDADPFQSQSSKTESICRMQHTSDINQMKTSNARTQTHIHPALHPLCGSGTFASRNADQTDENGFSLERNVS